MNKQMRTILGVLFLIVAFVAAFGCWFRYQQMQASGTWPKTTGKITVSEVLNVSIGMKEKYKARVEYDYAVDGQSQHGTQVRIGDITGSAESAQRALADAYPVGATVDVYYDPKSPNQAVLEPGGGARGFMLVLPPLILGGIGIAFLIAKPN